MFTRGKKMVGGDFTIPIHEDLFIGKLTMYRISSTNNWFNGRRFDSMVAAVVYAREQYKWGNVEVIDVVMDINDKYYRVIWSPEKSLIGRTRWKGKI